ncbi:MAG: hypothetical protein GF364_16885 [Candidatus Lokiarchaeota archaeon]|nr:hypothetical protein [Candidatus Lokiarchaeota archaeon]
MDKKRKIKNFNGIDFYREFMNGTFYEELYKEYDLTEDQLIRILQRKIKGRYNYKRILSGGHKSQLQFIKHLKNRWNPLEPEAPWTAIPPYLNPSNMFKVAKKRKEKTDDVEQ